MKLPRNCCDDIQVRSQFTKSRCPQIRVKRKCYLQTFLNLSNSFRKVFSVVLYSGKFSRTKIVTKVKACEIIFDIFIFIFQFWNRWSNKMMNLTRLNTRLIDTQIDINFCWNRLLRFLVYFRDSVYSPRNRENKNPVIRFIRLAHTD